MLALTATVVGPLIGFATALARSTIGEKKILAYVVLGGFVFAVALVLLRQLEKAPKRQFAIFVMFWIFVGGLALGIYLVARRAFPIPIHDLHAVTDKAYAQWTLRGKGEPHALVEVALELESGPLVIEKRSVPENGIFQIPVFGDGGYWVHAQMGLCVRQVFPNNPFVAADPWIGSLEMPATPDEYLKNRPSPPAARSASWYQKVTWNAPEAGYCTR